MSEATPDTRVPDTRVPDTRVPDNRVPETRVPDTRVPRLAVGCRVRTVSPDEAMLLVPEGALRLKGAASEIISLVDGSRSVDAIAALLQQKHTPGDADRISAEVKQFLDKLHARSVLLYKD